MRKLAVCWPWSVEFVPTRFADSALDLIKPEGYEVKFFRGRGWCSARRHNHCLEQAIGWGADYVCFIGADQVFKQNDALVRLVSHVNGDQWRAITALIPIRGHVGGQGTKPFQPIVWRHRQDDNGNQLPARDAYDVEIISPAMGDFVRIDGCGSGVLLFPTEALKHIQPPWFTEIASGNGFDRISCTDWPFVNRLQREAELEIWCDTTIKVTHLQMFEIDETFSDRFSDWDDPGKGDPNTCEYNEKPRRGGEIKQARVSPSITFYRDRFLKRYKLNDYESPGTPAFFFGCYTKQDLDLINSHGSDAVLIWAGSDALAFRNALEGNPNASRVFRSAVRHVAISKFIADDLDAMGIPYTRLPLCNVDESKFKPTPKGRAVYVYLPDHDREKYGGAMVDAVRAALPDVEFVIQSKLDPSADMPGIYAKCGVGLRLLQHDGLSNTCVELGLAGRRVIWNGDTPNALPYETVDDVVRLIRQELERPDDTEQVAAAVAEYLTLPQQWKMVEFFYGKLPSVSVVIPCYNHGKFIGRAVDSAKNQTIKPDEIIVVDDGSTDNSAAVAEAHGARVIRKENSGRADASNIGINAAKSEYVMVFDSDDFLEPTCIQVKLAKAVAENADAVYSSYKTCCDDGYEMSGPRIKLAHPGPLTTEDLSTGNKLAVTALMRRSAVLEVGGYSPDLFPWDDYEFWIRMTKAGKKVVSVPDVLWTYRVTQPTYIKFGQDRVDTVKQEIHSRHPDVFSNQYEEAAV